MNKYTIINGLRRVAEGHYAKTLTDRQRMFGICYAVLVEKDENFPLSEAVNKRIAPHIPPGDMYLCKPGTRWNQRAMFALLLAESLT